ncbi:hypothetical protein HY638_04615 [Candidatus Woesearchaeota archaeon]|nr:hypothetical protein [Candidatus Woesearchaeota archaeon]
MDEIKPDVRGAMAVQGMKVLGPVLAVLAVYVMMKALGILKIFSDAKEVLPGFFPSFGNLGMLLMAMIAVAITAVLWISYSGAKGTRYLFFPEKMVVCKGASDEGKEIPYSGITRVTMKKYPLLGVGKITLELSGLDEQKMEMDFIGNPFEVSKYIEGLRA